MVGQGHGRQSEAAVGAHVPVVQVQLQRIARVRGLVEPDRERDQPEVDLQDDDALVDALGLLRQDRADLFELIRIVGGVLVDHVVGDGVLGHHLALGVRLAQVPAPGREPDIEQQLHRPPRMALVAGHQPGEGRALGVADLVALVGDVGGHGIGPLAHGPPPGRVRLPVDAVPERGQVPGGEEQARMGLGREGLRGGGRGRAGDQQSEGGGQGRPGRKGLGNTHGTAAFRRWTGMGCVRGRDSGGWKGCRHSGQGTHTRIPPSPLEANPLGGDGLSEGVYISVADGTASDGVEGGPSGYRIKASLPTWTRSPAITRKR